MYRRPQIWNLIHNNIKNVFSLENIIRVIKKWNGEKCPWRICKRYLHCVKSVEIPSFFWSVFSCIQTKYGDSLGKYGPEKTPYLDTFHTVCKTEASNTNNHSLIKHLRRRFLRDSWRFFFTRSFVFNVWVSCEYMLKFL